MPNLKQVLNVGCGPRLPNKLNQIFMQPDWHELRLDIDPLVEPDIVASLTDMAPVSSASCDAVWSSHNLEHLYQHEVPLAFREFYRVLKNDGFLLVTLPDLQAVAKLIADGNIEQELFRVFIGGQPFPPIKALDIMYGHGSAIASGRTHMAHRTGFTSDTLGRYLLESGFRWVALKAGPEYDLWALAYKTEQDCDVNLLHAATAK